MDQPRAHRLRVLYERQSERTTIVPEKSRQREAARWISWPWVSWICLLALVLRVWRRSPIWTSSDAGDLAEFVQQRVCEPQGLVRDVSDLLLYRLGGLHPLVSYAQMKVASFLGLRVEELAWEMPSLLAGVAVVYAAYVVAHQLAGEAAGLSAAVLFTASPLNIMESRHLGAPWMFEQLLQLLIVASLLQLGRAPTQSARTALPVLVGTYAWTGNQMMGILPVLAYWLLVGLGSCDGAAARRRFVARRLGSPWWTFTACSVGTLLYDTFVYERSHLAHALFEKKLESGWYGENWFQDLTWALGAGGVWVALALSLVSLAGLRRLLAFEALPLVLFVSYTAPFLLTIPPGSTFTRGYIVYGVNALLLLCATAPWRVAMPRGLSAGAVGVLAVLLLVGAGQSAYRLWEHPWIGTRSFHGTYVENRGFKAAAAWVRARAEPGDRIFSDASGGGGLEPPLVTMYFQQPHFSLYDAKRLSPYRRFGNRRGEVAFLLVKPENRRHAATYFGSDFREAAVITEPERGESLVIYDRTHVGPPESISTNEGDALFTAHYSMLCRPRT